jgi:hypothetical protein
LDVQHLGHSLPSINRILLPTRDNSLPRVQNQGLFARGSRGVRVDPGHEQESRLMSMD